MYAHIIVGAGFGDVTLDLIAATAIAALKVKKKKEKKTKGDIDD